MGKIHLTVVLDASSKEQAKIFMDELRAMFDGLTKLSDKTPDISGRFVEDEAI
jgi:hypothetical protein